MHFDFHLGAAELKTGGLEGWRAEKEMGVVGGADALFRNAETVLVQLAATSFVVDDGDCIGAIRNVLEDVEIRLPYFVHSAFSERMFRLSRKSMLVIEKRDAEIAVAVVGVEHFDHDATGFDNRFFGG